MQLSVVVPVYNSERTLEALVGALQPILAQCADEYELILVNDGSKDRSWKSICQLSRNYPWIRGINLMRNYGQHNALLCGIRAASYPLVATMDDDLQNPPEELPKLLAALTEDYDVVYGTRESEQHGLWRNLASQAVKLMLQSAMGADTARKISAFRIIRTSVRNAFCDYRSPFVSIDVLLTWGTSRFNAVPISHRPRTVGRSNYRLSHLITIGLNLLTGFSTVPLQFATWNGFACLAFGIVVLIFVIGRYLIYGYSVPGFPFLASIIAIFAGAQMFSLGIIGAYLARMHSRSIDRPVYVIREEVSGAHLEEHDRLLHFATAAGRGSR